MTFQVPTQYCSLQHQNLLLPPVNPHPFILSGVLSPPISSSIWGTYWPGEFLFQCPTFLPFNTVHGILKARILKWFTIPFSSGPHSVRPLHHARVSWVAPRAWLSFIELDKAVVLVWLDWLVFCEYGFSVSVLWCPLATPTVLLGFVLLWAWGISSWLLQQSSAAAPYLGRRVSPHCYPFWPSTWDSSSWPSCAHEAIKRMSQVCKDLSRSTPINYILR